MTPNPRSNPYVGPRAFETGETLYGREVETERLFNLLLAERIVLFYSPSGAGKTSLLQAALIPRLQAEGYRVSPALRANEPLPEGVAGNRYVYSVLRSLEEARPPEARRDPAALAALTLDEYLTQREAETDPAAEPAGEVLLFDQFEETLTVNPTDLDDKTAFFAQVGAALRARHRWALFALREDYLAALEPYFRVIPTRGKAAFRLDLLGETAAREALQAPARAAGVRFADDAAQRLVDDLRRVQVQQLDGSTISAPGPAVEPVQLQVVAYRLWESLPPGAAHIGVDALTGLGDVNRVLRDYYAQSVARIAAETGVAERAIREWVARQLITAQGRRDVVARGPESSGGLANAAIGRLVGVHLVRAEQRAGATWYELAHDRLVEPLQADNAAWFAEHLSLLQRQAALWDEEKRAAGLLLNGDAWAEAEAWAAGYDGELTDVETDFLTACRKELERQQLEAAMTQRLAELERQQAIAELEKQRAEEQEKANRELSIRNRRIGRLAIGAVVLMVLGIAAAGFGWQQRNAALKSQATAEAEATRALNAEATARAEATRALSAEATAQAEATRALSAEATAEARRLEVEVAMATAEAEGKRAEQKAQIALARQLGAQAQYMRDYLPTQLPRALLLSIESLRRYPQSAMINQTLAKGFPLLPIPITRITYTGVKTVVFSSDGQNVMSDGSDGTTQTWEAATGYEITRATHAGTWPPMAVSPDGQWKITGSEDNTWVSDIATGREITRLMPTGWVYRATFSPDGQWVATGSLDGTVRVWEASTGREIAQMAHTWVVSAIAFSPDGQWVASGSWDGTTCVWEAATGREVARSTHAGWVWDVVFSPDGQWIAAGHTNNRAWVWNIADAVNNTGIAAGREVTLTHEGAVYAVAFSPDGQQVLTGSGDNTARVWETTTGYEIMQLPHAEVVWEANFSPDGRWIATGSGNDRVWVWDVSAISSTTAATGQEVIQLWRGEGMKVVAFSPDGKWVGASICEEASGYFCFSPSVRVWAIETGLEIMRVYGSDVNSMAFSPDNRWLVTGSEDGTAQVWDVITGRLIVQMLHESGVNTVAFSSDGQRVVTGGLDGIARVWEITTGQEIAQIAHKSSVNAMAFSPNGQWIVSGSGDNTARVWGTTTGQKAVELSLTGEVNAVAFSPDGRRIATGSWDGMIWIWDVSAALNTGAAPGRTLAWMMHEASVNAVAFSPDGQWVVSGSDDNTARVWETMTGHEIARLTHKGFVNAVAFSPDGRQTLSNSSDGTMQVSWWQPEDIIRLACERLPRNLTREEWQQYLGDEPYRATCPNLPEAPASNN
ncbi:MAG TPA: hypothetical protein PKH77_15225 [Anaerolineae bacterium]|nr:hypothetical protein [Anaerolineae bacterium]